MLRLDLVRYLQSKTQTLLWWVYYFELKNVTPEEGTAYHSLNSRLISRTTIVLQPADCTCGRKTVTKIYLLSSKFGSHHLTWLMGWKLSISWQEWGELEESHSNEQHEDNDMERPILAPSDFVERNSVGRNVGFWILVKFWSFPF